MLDAGLIVFAIVTQQDSIATGAPDEFDVLENVTLGNLGPNGIEKHLREALVNIREIYVNCCITT